jgi:rod shape-determining protein MreC
MARAARLSGRLDTVVFGFLVVLALIAKALPTQMRDPVASGLRRSIVAPLVGMQRGAERWRSAWLESERKTLQRDSLALIFAQTQALQVENERLRKLLGLGSRLGWGFIPAEALHTSGRAEDVITTLTLTAGSNAGVTRFSPVVAWEGIVGMVQTVDPRMSIAILYSHPDFRVSAMSADGKAFGIVYPHLEMRPTRRAERYLLELRNVPSRDTLKAGTPIYSSGLGGTWPRGVLIGHVMTDVKEAEGWSRVYLIRPAVNPAQVTSVMILTPQRGSQGVGSIWAEPGRSATFTRGIVSAGDSLARELAVAQAAALRQSLDSLRRAGLGDSLRPRVDTVDSLGRQRGLIIGGQFVDTMIMDMAQRDSIRRVIARRDSIRRARRDSIRRDSIARDTVRRDTIPPGGNP